MTRGAKRRWRSGRLLTAEQWATLVVVSASLGACSNGARQRPPGPPPEYEPRPQPAWQAEVGPDPIEEAIAEAASASSTSASSASAVTDAGVGSADSPDLADGGSDTQISDTQISAEPGE